MNRDQFEQFFSEQVTEGTDQLINSIKLILYKIDNQIFEELNFENEEIYLEPILFAALNSNLNVDVNSVIWGYKEKEKIKQIILRTDENGRIYMPNIGYFQISEPYIEVQLSFDSKYLIHKENELIDFKFEEIFKIHDHFELVTNPIYVIEEQFFDEFENHTADIILAFDSIKKYAPNWYEIMKKVTRKIVIFNDQSEKRNSFATQSVHGCAFFNAFQENYNEVFFIEDIAHQCGHIIFNAYLANKPNIFRIDKNTDIYLKGERNIYNEPRALYVMIHAMYTYESIFTCFNGCLMSKTFFGDKKHELYGRLAFTLMKFERDFELLSITDADGRNQYITDEGIELINQFKESYKLCIVNWGENLNTLNLENQPYNFSYSKFLEINPIHEYEIK